MPKKMESEATFYDCNIITVGVSDTGPMGGDAGHGCRVTFSVKDEAGTCMYINGKRVNEFEIEVCGDSERRTFLQALVFAAESIKAKGG